MKSRGKVRKQILSGGVDEEAVKYLLSDASTDPERMRMTFYTCNNDSRSRLGSTMTQDWIRDLHSILGFMAPDRVTYVQLHHISLACRSRFQVCLHIG